MIMIEWDGDELLYRIKQASWFPYKSGRLKNHATSGMMYNLRTYRIHFSGSVAPYVQYLEEGTKPHNIPRAFGRPLPFGTSGRFNGMFHPGSTKHKGFISEKAVGTILDYFCTKYNGEVL